MKSHSHMRSFLAFFLCSFSIHSYADQWYHVEMIVFEQLNSSTDELWPVMTEIENQAVGQTPSLLNATLQADNIQTLTVLSDQLNRSPKYLVHYHQAWKQPISKKESAMPMLIHSKNNMITGSLRLYKSIYLHAAVDLWLMEKKFTDANTDADELSALAEDGSKINEIRNPNLIESRRIRSKKLYFFDHPKMGVLLEIMPIETPKVKK